MDQTLARGAGWMNSTFVCGVFVLGAAEDATGPHRSGHVRISESDVTSSKGQVILRRTLTDTCHRGEGLIG